MKLADSMPWLNIKNAFVAHFNATMGGFVKPFLVGVGALLKKNHLGLTEEKAVLKSKEKTQM